jgi:hypothetical protein
MDQIVKCISIGLTCAYLTTKLFETDRDEEARCCFCLLTMDIVSISTLYAPCVWIFYSYFVASFQASSSFLVVVIVTLLLYSF